MLTQAQKNQITAMATRDFGDNISMAASLHKLVEERDGYEKAVEAVEFYCQEQRACIDTLEAQADEHVYQIQVEM